MENLRKMLEQINWDFFDYNSSKYPLDISSIPWYLATFPAPIPKFLIGLLTETGETVLDPFGGAGTTCYEAIKQNRPFLYNDINPFVAEMVSSLVLAARLAFQTPPCLKDLTNRDIVTLQNVSLWEDKLPYTAEERGMERDLEAALAERHIASDAVYWYHRKTLIELLAIWDLIHDQGEDPDICKIRKLAFSNILKETCSQRDHFTYITDNCKPKKLVYISALKAYATMMHRIDLSTTELSHNYQILNRDNCLNVVIDRSVIRNGDARDLSWIQDESVDFVLTSPPYLCAQDYIKTMRLQDLFFHGEDLAQLAEHEIGARAKRKGNQDRVVNTFYQDIHASISEVNRVLKPHKYFCIIIGQGKGKITHGIDTVSAIREDILTSFSFELFFEAIRKISYKTVRIGGVDTETLLIFKKAPK